MKFLSWHLVVLAASIAVGFRIKSKSRKNVSKALDHRRHSAYSVPRKKPVSEATAEQVGEVLSSVVESIQEPSKFSRLEAAESSDDSHHAHASLDSILLKSLEAMGFEKITMEEFLNQTALAVQGNSNCEKLVCEISRIMGEGAAVALNPHAHNRRHSSSFDDNGTAAAQGSARLKNVTFQHYVIKADHRHDKVHQMNLPPMGWPIITRIIIGYALLLSIFCLCVLVFRETG